MRFETFVAAVLAHALAFAFALVFALVFALAGCRDRRAAKAPAAVVVEIQVELAGEAAATVEDTVVVPLEHVVAKLAGIRSIQARSDNGLATLTLEVERSAEDRIVHELTHALAEARPRLPAEAGWPVIQRTRGEPLVWLAVRGSLPITVLSQHVRDDIIPALHRIPGIADIHTQGLAEEHVVVHFELARLEALGLTLADIATHLPRGRTDVETLSSIAIGPAKLHDVATIELGAIRDAREPALAIRAHATTDRTKMLAELRRVIAAAAARRPAGDVELVEVPWPQHRAPLTVTLHGPNREVLEAAATKLTATLATHEISNVTRDPPAPLPSATITIDRARAADHGVAPTHLSQTSRVLAGAPLGEIIPKLDEPDLGRAVERVRIRTARGELIPLASIADVKTTLRGPLLRRDREAAITFAIDAPADKLVAARAAVRELALPTNHRATVR